MKWYSQVLPEIWAGNYGSHSGWKPRSILFSLFSGCAYEKSQEEIAQSLHGLWRQELLFELQASLDFYKHYQNALLSCDQVIEQALRRSVPVESVSKPAEKKLSKNKKKPSKHTDLLPLNWTDLK